MNDRKRSKTQEKKSLKKSSSFGKYSFKPPNHNLLFGHYLNKKSTMDNRKDPPITKRDQSINSKEDYTQDAPLTEPTSRRPSLSTRPVKDRKNIVIKVDIEGSNHANLKKAQYINQVKEVYNAETKYVGSANQITMEVFLLQQSIEKIKDEILLQLNLELKKAIKLIESASTKSEIQINTFALDNSKIESIKSELNSIFADYQFKVESDQLQEITNRQIATEVIDRITSNPLLDYLHRARESEEIPETNRESKADDEANNQASKGSIEAVKASFSSLRHVMNKKMPERKSVEAEVVIVEAPSPSNKENKESMFESIFKPSSSKKLDDNNKLFEFEGEFEVPDVTDSNFNTFLEKELERIKKTFLEDGPVPQAGQLMSKVNSRKQSDKLFEEIQPEGTFSKRAASIGHKKSVHAMTQSPRQRKGLGGLSYKDKFEDLYFKGKLAKGEKESKKATPNLKCSTKGLGIPVTNLQEEFKSISQTSKSLSKYARQPNAGPLAGFSPLFKAD